VGFGSVRVVPCAWFRARGSVRVTLANRAAPPRDRSANAAETAGSIALGSRSAAARLRSLGAVWRGLARGSVLGGAVSARVCARAGDCWNGTA